MKHSIRLTEKNIIEIVIDGPVTVNEAVSLGHEGRTIVTKLQDSALPVKVLLDSTRSPQTMDTEVRNMASIIYKDLPFEKIASFGAFGAIKDRQEAIFKKAEKMNQVRFFSNRETAEKWLLE